MPAAVHLRVLRVPSPGDHTDGRGGLPQARTFALAKVDWSPMSSDTLLSAAVPKSAGA